MPVGEVAVGESPETAIEKFFIVKLPSIELVTANDDPDMVAVSVVPLSLTAMVMPPLMEIVSSGLGAVSATEKLVKLIVTVSVTP